MKRIASLAVGLALSLPLSAQEMLTTWRMGNAVLRPGDSSDAIRKVPDHKFDLINAFGVKLGEQWEYHDRGKVTALQIHGGRISNIFVVRN